MTITLNPEIENALADEARRRGTTPELLALDCLRACLLPGTAEEAAAPAGSLAHFLAGHLGVLSSREHVPSGAGMSENCGTKFAEGLLRKWQQGRL